MAEYSNWFDEAFEKLLFLEGGYVKHPSDPGGATNFGVTQVVFSKHFPGQDVRYATREQAKIIYWRDYWKPMKLDNVADKKIAMELFEQGVNLGPARAIKHAQKACNFLSGSAGRAEIAVDGVIGPQTLEELGYWADRNIKALINSLNGLQFLHYYRLVTETDWADPFGAGWAGQRTGSDD
jgi:lysozyme family protein